MKKITFLLAALLLIGMFMTGCKATVPTDPAASAADTPEIAEDVSASDTDLPAIEEPAPETETDAPEINGASASDLAEFEDVPAEYVEVLQQYRKAALSENFDPADFPMVLPEAIEVLQKRWATYPDDESHLHASYADVTGDGVEELFVFFDDYDEDQYTTLCGIYGIENGEAVKLLGDEPLTLDDTYTFFEGNVLAHWQGGRYHTPGTVRLFHFTGGTTQTETWTWNYKGGEWPTYTNEAGETLDGAGFFSPYVLTEPAYRSDEEMTEWGYALPVALVENPGTCTEPQLVTAMKVDYPGAYYGESVTLPQIALEGGDYDRFNTEMQELAERISSGEENVGEGMNFDWAVNGDILSVWTHTYYGGGYDNRQVYNFSMQSKRQIADDELMTAFAIRWDDYQIDAITALHGASVSLDVYYAGGGGLGGVFGSIITDHANEYFAEAQPTVDRNGRLVLFGEVASIAGGSSYMRMVAVCKVN